MTTEAKPIEQEKRQQKVVYKTGASEAVYGLGLIGAWVYYLTHAATFWIGAVGIVKGIFWPAFVVYELMKFFGM